MRLVSAKNLFLLLLLSSSSVLWGQAGTGEIDGTVRDSTGAVLPNVKVTLTQQESGASREVVTNSGGTFVAASLPIGAYTVKAELANFKTEVRDGIAVQVGRQEHLDFVLSVGEKTET